MTPEWMAFFLKYTSGFVCCAITSAKANDLNLPLMVQKNQDEFKTAYTISVDEVTTKTGISATERALTCKSLATVSKSDQFKRPGHIMPLISKNGGVLERRGHTEAGVDLCKLANLAPCAVISEITTDDKVEMARTSDLMWFAHNNDLKLITIDDLAKFQMTSATRESV